MQKVIRFLRGTAFNGLLILIPILLLWSLLDEVLLDIVAMAEPLAAMFPNHFLPAFLQPWISGAILLLLLCLAVGLVARITFVGRFFMTLERRTLGRISVYQLLKRWADSLLGKTDGQSGAYSCALLTLMPGRRQLVYVIEKSAEQTTVLIPTAPAGLSGQLLLVDNDQLNDIDTSVAEAMLVINKLGDGYQSLLKKSL